MRDGDEVLTVQVNVSLSCFFPSVMKEEKSVMQLLRAYPYFELENLLLEMEDSLSHAGCVN